MEGYIYLVLMFFTSGFSTVFMKKLLNDGMTPFNLQFYTSIVTLLLFFSFNLKNLSQRIKLSFKDFYVNSIAAFTGFVIFEICFNLSMQYMNVSEAMVLYYLNPIFLYFAGKIFLNSSSFINHRILFGLFVAFFGVCFMVTNGTFSSFNLNLNGVIYMVIAIFSIIFFIIFNKKNRINERAYFLLSNIFSVIVCLFQIIFSGQIYFPNVFQMLYIFMIAILYNFLNLIFYLKASKEISLERFTVLSYLSPIVTSILSIFILGEKVSFSTFLGLLLVIVGNLVAV